MIKDRSDPSATIGFVIYYPFQFYVYKNIYKELKQNSEFIIDQQISVRPSVALDLLQEIKALLEKEGISYRILYKEDYYNQTYLRDFFSRYKALVSVWERGCMVHPATAHLKKISTTYGAGKDLTLTRPSRGLYDLILSYGPRDTALFSYYTHAEMVGNPKFDNWFNGTIDQNAISTMREYLDPAKKTILYLPTHSDLSSIDLITSELDALRDEHNVIAKVHYYTTREEPERMALLRKTGIILETDETDLLPLLCVADVVISDNSSAIFDVILADKAIVVADFWDKEYLDHAHKELRRYDLRAQGALTYSDSIEQVIKRDGSVITVKTPGELRGKIDEAFRDKKHYKDRRTELRAELFAYNDGKCAVRAAKAIQDCIANTSPRTRPILYHAIEAYKRHIGLLSYERERYLNKEIARYESILDDSVSSEGILFSFIYIRERNVDPEIERRTLWSVLAQEFPSEKYEVVLCGMSHGEFAAIAATLPEWGKSMPNVREIPDAGGSLSRWVSDAVNMARGTYVCFVSSTCAVPSRWLSTLYLVYKKESTTAGVGGYVYAQREASSFDDYRYYDIAKQLNIFTKDRLAFRFFFEATNQLFDQNPTGDLRVMSYRRDRLVFPLPESDNLTYIGLYLKLAVIGQWPLTFVPCGVPQLQKIERKEFLRSERIKGFFYRMHRTDIELVWPYKSINLVSTLWSGICEALRSKRVAPAYVFPAAACMQLVGRLEAISRISLLMSRWEN